MIRDLELGFRQTSGLGTIALLLSTFAGLLGLHPAYDAQLLQNRQRFVSNTSLFIYKIRGLAISKACPCRVLHVFGHHSIQPRGEED